MPADHTLSDRPTAMHGNGDAPYPCHERDQLPGAAWSIRYGYCRHSLDDQMGHADPRCPADCPHKAPAVLVRRFSKHYAWHGALAAAEMARKHKEKSP